MNPKCARCEKTVYPMEKLNCLDKYWHKGCFNCEVCRMTLNMKNYKGKDKNPYCNAHYPQSKPTVVSETPEIARVMQQSQQQSLVKYHQAYEKSKAKGYTSVVDTPENIRVKESGKIVSQVGQKTSPLSAVVSPVLSLTSHHILA
ncbi:LIM and SH3 domain protein 1-like isoform X2 [Branchiostoma lanceolatum]|uniref:LIM and SH3 domain protein 1-like isoform X2 n=1 Tax=Branchiostoma lanceolatum TaxID=7740 RepID=UPI003452B770